MHVVRWKSIRSWLLLVLLVLALATAIVHVAHGPPPADSGTRSTPGNAAPDAPILRGAQPPAPSAAARDEDGSAAALSACGRTLVLPDDGGLPTPVPGALVRAYLVRGEVVEELAELRADDRGAFDLPLARLAALSPVLRAASKLRVLASASGYGLEYGIMDGGWPETPVVDVELGRPLDADAYLIAMPDAVRGRVVDEDGRPVADAWIAAWPVTGSADPPETGYFHVTDPRGTYTVSVAPGQEYVVEARQTGLGLGWIDRVHVPAEGGCVEVPDVVLGGPRSIKGRVRFPDGSPAAGVAVTCGPEGVTGRPWPPATGLHHGSTRSDAAGRFRIAGLGRRTYRVVCGGRVGKPRSDPAIADCLDGPASVSLVATVPRIRLRVEDEEGHPVPGASYFVDYGQSQTERGTVEAADGTLNLWFRPGTPLRVAATCHVPTIPPVEAEVSIPEGQWSEDVTLVLRAIDPRLLAQVNVTVRWPEGTPAEPFCAALSSPLAGVLHARRCSSEGTGGGVLSPVAPGRWQLVIWQDRATDRAPARRWQRWTKEVEVAPGEIVDVAATVTPE